MDEDEEINDTMSKLAAADIKPTIETKPVPSEPAASEPVTSEPVPSEPAPPEPVPIVED